MGPGRAGAARCQRGAATVEFYIVVFLVMVPMLMAVLQLGLFMVANNTVHVATLNAARAGAASGVDPSEMRRAFASGVAPLYAAGALANIGAGAFADISDHCVTGAGLALGTANADVAANPANKISVLNPTRVAFADFGITHQNQRIIPVDNLLYDNTMGGKTKQRRSDALLLKIEAQYCYRMVIPIIDKLVIDVLVWSSSNRRALACYLQNGVPIISQAVVRMTVPPVESGVFP
jgi:hypothetical protein